MSSKVFGTVPGTELVLSMLIDLLLIVVVVSTHGTGP